MPKKPNTETRLKEAREAAAEATAKIRELEAKRADALLRDDDDGAAKLLAEIERLRAFRSGLEDKAKLLEAEVRKETAQRHAREKEGLIGRIESRLAAREAVAAELVTVIGRANALMLELFESGHAIDCAFGWQGHDRKALLLLPDDLVAAFQHELYRQTAIPKLGGGQKEAPHAGWKFPGAKPPRIEQTHQPKSIPPLVSVLQDASTYASNVMRGRRTPTTTAPVVPVTAPEPREPTMAEGQLAGLLRRQSELAAIEHPTPEDDRAYGELVKQISQAQASIEEQPNAR
jgi:hypothetical protein